MNKENKEELAQKYLDFYHRAVDDMERQGIYDKIKLFDKYWQGKQREPRSENDPCSNTNIIHPTVEGQVALLCEQNITVNALPVSPSEVPFAERATQILEFVKNRNKMERVIEVHERRREKYGTGILRCVYDPDLLSGAGLPVIECVPNQNLLVDPCITDALKLNEAEFIIERVVKSVFWAKQVYGEEVASQIEENYFPYGECDVFGEEDTDGENAKYLHLLVWTCDGGKLRLVEMSADGTILSDSADKSEAFYATGKYPYFLTPLYTNEGTIWGMGDVELLIPVQDLINDLDDQIRLNAALTANPQRLVETSSGIDLEFLTNEPGLNIPVNNINAVKDLEPASIPNYIVERRNLALQYEGQRISRFSDQMLGNKQQGVDTATESLALQQNGTQGIGFKKMLLQDTFSDVFSYALALVREFWTDEVEFRVSDDSSEFIHFNPAELQAIEHLTAPEGGETFLIDGVKLAEFDIVVSVGAGLPSNKAFQYNMFRELTQMGIITPFEFRRWLVTGFGLPLDPQHPQEQQMQQMQAQQSTVPQAVPMQQSAEIEGISANGRPMPSQMQEGGMM